MFRSQLQTALRNLIRHKFHSAINILGLAIGISCAFIISLFLIDETSYDRHHTNAENIYRIAHKRSLEGSFRNMATTPLFLAEKVKSDFAMVEKTVRFMQESFGSFRLGEKLFPEQRFCFADEELLEMFNIPLLAGSASGVLNDPTSILISEEMAAKYFGNEDALGKVLTWVNWGREFEYKVAGIFETIPDNSHFQFDFFTAYDSDVNLWKSMHGEDWHYSGAWTYVQLPANTDPGQLESALNTFAENELPAPLNTSTEFYLQPLLDIHLHSNLASEVGINGNATTVYIFTVIGLLVLVISCINFVNLTTARALTRSKEVGVRKVIGAIRSHLIRQFLTESILVSLFAGAIALILSALAMPFFNQLAQKNISLFAPGDISKLWFIPVLALFTGIVAGLYPALVLSGFKPVNALKSSIHGSSKKGALMRKALVTLQFSISIMLLIAIGTISKQLNYLKNKELGFDKEGIVFLNGYDWREYTTLKTKLEGIPGVLNVTGGSSLPGTSNATPMVRMARLEQKADEDRLEVHIGLIDANYLEFLNIAMTEGRSFSENMVSDQTESVIVNEAFLRQAGIEDSPLGTRIAQYDMMGNYANTKSIVGVLKDFHMESLHGSIRPIIYNLNLERNFNTVVKVNTNNLSQTLEQIQEQAESHASGSPIDIHFLDEDIEQLYQQEDRLSRIISLFTGLALLISCLGILGLASHITMQKTKEIGIRKVLGASAFSLLTLLTRQMTLLVLVAFFIGAPIAWYVANQWLNNFAYHINPGIGMFLIVVVLSLVITWITIGYQSFRAVLTNPVHSLRDE